MKLSILIATIEGREKQFETLMGLLDKQVTKEVEILSWKDNKEASIGRKRQALLEAATGDYVVYIDDDDSVADNYVSEILKALESKPDCVGFQERCNLDGNLKKADWSLRYKKWDNDKNGFDFVRTPFHKTPVKRELALKVGFKDMRYAEDKDYSDRLYRLLKTEEYIPQELYFYNYSSAISHNVKYGIKR